MALFTRRQKQNKSDTAIRSRKIWIIVVLLVITLAGTTVGYHFLYAKAATENTEYQQVKLEHGDLALTFKGKGTTQLAAVEQNLKFDPSVVPLVVEEVYVTSGDNVKEGDSLLKLTDDSVKKAMEYYESAVADAQDTLSNASNNYNIGMLEAAYTKEGTLTTAEYANVKYNASLTDLDQKVTDTKSSYEDAQNQIATYQTALDSNSYYTDNQIDEKQTAADEAQKAAEQAKESQKSATQNYQKLQDTVSKEIETLGEDDLEPKKAQLKKDYEDLIKAKENADHAESDAQKAMTEASQKQSEVQQAHSQYDRQVDEANQKIQQLQANLSKLQSDYEQALRNAVTQKVEVKKTYDSAVVDGEYAQTTYDSTINQLSSTLESAQKALDTLKEQKEAFDAMQGGVITASQDGTIASVAYEADDTLQKDAAVVSYTDPGKILISIEVDQSNMNHIAVGDEVKVTVTGVRGSSLTGKIQTIATTATADSSASKVTYTVVVAVDNSDGAIQSGLSATVTCNYGTLNQVYYLPVDAVSGINGTSGKVKKYDKDGQIETVPVTIGQKTDEYIVITEGISQDDTCLIEAGGKSNEKEK